MKKALIFAAGLIAGGIGGIYLFSFAAAYTVETEGETWTVRNSEGGEQKWKITFGKKPNSSKVGILWRDSPEWVKKGEEVNETQSTEDSQDNG